MATIPRIYNGSQFRELRRSINLSVYKLSKLSNVGQLTIRNYEREKITIRISTYVKLCDVIQSEIDKQINESLPTNC